MRSREGVVNSFSIRRGRCAGEGQTIGSSGEWWGLRESVATFARCARVSATGAAYLIVALGASCARPGAAPPRAGGLAAGSHTFTIQHGGRTRAYIVHVPAQVARRSTPQSAPRSAPPSAPHDVPPVVLAFHGGGGDAAQFQASAGLDPVAEREGFVVVYPHGSGVLPRRLLTWNAGECCGYSVAQNVDDVGFVTALLDDLARHTPYDRRRVYATGHSNGAMMAYRFAAERADRVTAIAPVAGAYSLNTFSPSHPVAVLHIHSVDDPRALYGGGIGPPFPGTQVRSSHRPVIAGLALWARHNGCADEPRVAAHRDGAARTADAEQTATLLVWDGCLPAAAVEHWRLTGVGHGWPGSPTRGFRDDLIGPPTTLVIAAEEVWRFFARQRR